MTFGEKLQLLRKSKGWTQEQLSAQINISRQALSKWESGAAMPDTENVIRLSRLFAVSTDYLLLDEYDEPVQNYPEKDCLPPSKKNTAHFERMIAGSIAAGLSVVILLVVGVLSSVTPAVYSVSPAGVEWTRVYTGLSAFLKVHNLEWFWWLWVIALIGGVITLLYDRMRPVLQRFIELLRNRSKHF